LQTAGGKIPKWNSRICLGIYLGQSPVHVSTVTLVLNPMTGHALAQFHDNFSTINNICLPGQMTKRNQWKELCNASNKSFVKEKQTIDNLWPTFDPKELFVDYYNAPAAADNDAPPACRVSFADPFATAIAPSEGVTTRISNTDNAISGQHLTPRNCS
jgi:hypothetical protein